MNHHHVMNMFGALVVGAVASAHAQQPKSINVAASDVRPAVSDLPVSGSTVTDLHLRPLFTTTIRLPEPVTSVAVGAPTLFDVEHSDEEPRLVFVKPSTRGAVTSNLIIALQSGQEISMRLLSDGSAGSTPIDFVVNYKPKQSFLIGSTDMVARNASPSHEPPRQVAAIDEALKRQSEVAAPDWVGGLGKDARTSGRKAPGKPLLGTVGDVRERGEEMLVAYSVMNTTDHWIEVLPPQVELNSPNLESVKVKDKKKQEILAEQVPIMEYRLNTRRLGPGARADGAVEFSRPGFKQSKDRLLLQLATTSEVDHPLLIEVPFVAPGK
jgi:hypothetical protein